MIESSILFKPLTIGFTSCLPLVSIQPWILGTIPTSSCPINAFDELAWAPFGAIVVVGVNKMGTLSPGSMRTGTWVFRPETMVVIVLKIGGLIEKLKSPVEDVEIKTPKFDEDGSVARGNAGFELRDACITGV